jgi:hypothetical protein
MKMRKQNSECQLSRVDPTTQLQITDTITPPAWTNAGPSQAGTGGVLTFTDTGGLLRSQRFYRVAVGP